MTGLPCATASPYGLLTRKQKGTKRKSLYKSNGFATHVGTGPTALGLGLHSSRQTAAQHVATGPTALGLGLNSSRQTAAQHVGTGPTALGLGLHSSRQTAAPHVGTGPTALGLGLHSSRQTAAQYVATGPTALGLGLHSSRQTAAQHVATGPTALGLGLHSSRQAAAQHVATGPTTAQLQADSRTTCRHWTNDCTALGRQPHNMSALDQHITYFSSNRYIRAPDTFTDNPTHALLRAICTIPGTLTVESNKHLCNM